MDIQSKVVVDMRQTICKRIEHDSWSQSKSSTLSRIVGSSGDDSHMGASTLEPYAHYRHGKPEHQGASLKASAASTPGDI